MSQQEFTPKVGSTPDNAHRGVADAAQPSVPAKPARSTDAYQQRAPNQFPPSQQLGKKISLAPTTSSKGPNGLSKLIFNPNLYRAIARDPLFTGGNLKDSRVLHFLQGRFLMETKRGRSGDPSAEPISLRHLAQLFSLRQSVQDKPSLRELLRFEIRWLRETRREGASHEKAVHSAQRERRAGGKEDTRAFLKKQSQIIDQLDKQQLAGESPFEQVLKHALAGKELVKSAADGTKPAFAAKSEAGWKTFFKNVLSRGSVEQSVLRSTEQVREGLFRGLVHTLGEHSTPTLVSDLHHGPEGGRQLADKFSRVLVTSPVLAEGLNGMKPGEPIPAEFFRQLGQEIEVIRLQHQVVRTDMSEEARQQALAQLRNPANLEAHGRLESALLDERQRRLEEQKRGALWLRGHHEAHPHTPSWFWWGADPQKKFERHLGRFRPWIFFSYCIAITLAIVIGVILFRHFH